MNLFGSFNKNRSSSIFLTIFIPMILLVLMEVMLFAGSLIVNQVMDHLNQNQRDIVEKQLETRKEVMENYLVGTVSDLHDLSGVINNQLRVLFSNKEVRFSTLDLGVTSSDVLLSRITNQLVSTLRSKRVSGIFVILNTHDLSRNYRHERIGKKPCLYIRDMDPVAIPSTRNEDLTIEYGSIGIVQSSKITTSNDWTPMFDFVATGTPETYDFFYLPFQTAYETEGRKDAHDFAFWGLAPSMAETEAPYNMTYTVPLIYDDGTVYGVAGVELSAQYLKSLLPFEELVDDASGSYILGTIDEKVNVTTIGNQLELKPAVIHGKETQTEKLREDVLYLTQNNFGGYTFQDNNINYYAQVNPFHLYNSNTPFENRKWVLTALIPNRSLYSFSNQVLFMLAMSILLMLFTGMVGSFLIGQNISDPISELSRSVLAAQVNKESMPELEATGIREIDQLTGAISSLSRDVAEAHAMEQRRIEHERDYDLLTSLMNRRAFLRELNTIFHEPKSLKHGAMVMLDLDGLKEVNDNYGHDWGDNYLFQAARAFEDALPKNSLIARISGDEFYILYRGFDSAREVKDEIEKLRKSISERRLHLPGNKELPVSASGGVALYPEDAKDYTTLIRLADFTMYQVKLNGKNNIAYFDADLYEKQSSVMQTMSDLNQLLINPQMVTYFFQPIFNAHTGAVFSYEALMRVSTTTLKNPADVILLARQNNRLLEVEEVTWIRTLECFADLQKKNKVDAQGLIFINSFPHLSLTEEEQRALASRFSDLIPRVVIEITEAEAMDEEATAIKRSMPGFTGQFALDDYGSGYNSELMLLALKPQYVKVDISIIRDIDTSPDKQKIVSNILNYSHEREMKVIAEGIETESELAKLLEMGIDLVQGYYLSRPAKEPATISAQALACIRSFHK